MASVQTQRKLIDLSLPTIQIIGRKARSRSMSFKRYVEMLVEEDAGKTEGQEVIPEEVTDKNLIGLIGIARPLNPDAEHDDRLDYILSKL